MTSLLLIAALSELAVYPPAVDLHGSEATAAGIVHQQDGEIVGTPVNAELTLADEAVAKLVGGRVVPVADGETTLTVTLGDQTTSVPVVVQGASEPFEYSFTNHVLPVLSKAGCNMGACHGALAGKGGTMYR